MDLWVREARLFKYGSGTGTNFSKLRGEGERLSGGGKSSGLMSFLKIGDRAAGAIKSGGTTRRAAKMVTVDLDHPDIEQFIDWKVGEEQKVAALVAGSKLCDKHLNAIMQACHAGARNRRRRSCFDPKVNRALKKAIVAAREAMIPENYIQRVIQFARQGYTRSISGPTTPIGIPTPTSPSPARTPTTRCASPTSSSRRVQADGEWKLMRRTDGKVAQDHARRATSGTRSPTPPGRAPIPACSSTPPSTNGTPARRAAASTPPTRAPNTCSWTTRPATWRRST